MNYVIYKCDCGNYLAVNLQNPFMFATGSTREEAKENLIKEYREVTGEPGIQAESILF